MHFLITKVRSIIVITNGSGDWVFQYFFFTSTMVCPPTVNTFLKFPMTFVILSNILYILEATLLFVDFHQALFSIHKAKMEPIILAYDLT